MWEKLSWKGKLLVLEGETTVMFHLLIDNEELVKMVKRGDTHAACLAFINDNW